MYCATELPSLVVDESPLVEVEHESAPPIAGGIRTTSSGELERWRERLRSGLGRSRGPFGPRQDPYRLFLIPAALNRQGAHWLRHRLADNVGIDLYTARSLLNRLVPSYLAGSDERETLEAMAVTRPGTLEDLAAIRGMGPKRVAKFGEGILALLASFRD